MVRDRIRRYYGRDSTVIFPPAELGTFQGGAEPEDFYLVLARLVPYKRLDVAVEAFNRLGRRLVVVGDGRDRARLTELAGPTVSFLGRQPQATVRDLLARCQALVWPGVEDYGLAPVEAMAAGRPVIARRAGGVLDTVVEGAHGRLLRRRGSRGLGGGGGPGRRDCLAAAGHPASCRGLRAGRVRGSLRDLPGRGAGGARGAGAGGGVSGRRTATWTGATG